MKTDPMDQVFSEALRAHLVRQVTEEGTTAARRRRRRLWLGVGAFAGAGVLGGVGAAAAGFFTLPGSDVITELSGPVDGVYTGSASIDLGPAPEGSTHISVKVTCLSPGTLFLDEAGTITCSPSDIGSPSSVSEADALPISTGNNSVDIRTQEADMRWRAEARYINRTPTELGVNEKGETYGAAHNSQGVAPDLVAVIATNGRTGYAYSDALNVQPQFDSPEEAIAWQEEHRGEEFPIPVYESDGETVIGEFIVSGPPELADLP
ncbi:peptidase M56 family protein [Arthrobacter sp. JZ12]|uniref:peptidase M56 family protein n=1 Tax=Arthrobacter sp. JZ12 TaxID=2654190 RepID=UPI002B494B52|nr:peptidase M56 family protein [Arthrobacter sp. JZ12]WRH25824.1 peptidase M56 family protein [Arthrobacter sp. JZ12]